MRDEIDARFWNDHHEAFADSVDRALGRLKNMVARFAEWDGTTHQLLALVAAFAITTLTFQSTTV